MSGWAGGHNFSYRQQKLVYERKSKICNENRLNYQCEGAILCTLANRFPSAENLQCPPLSNREIHLVYMGKIGWSFRVGLNSSRFFHARSAQVPLTIMVGRNHSLTMAQGSKSSLGLGGLAPQSGSRFRLMRGQQYMIIYLLKNRSI